MFEEGTPSLYSTLKRQTLCLQQTLNAGPFAGFRSTIGVENADNVDEITMRMLN